MTTLSKYIVAYEYNLWFPSHPFNKQDKNTIRFNHLVYAHNFTDQAADNTKKLVEFMFADMQRDSKYFFGIICIQQDTYIYGI
jgi:hypothetical protein